VGLPRELVTNHLYVHLLTHLEPEISDEVFINPRLKLAHPALILALACDEGLLSMNYKALGFQGLTKGLSSLRSVGLNLERPVHRAGLEMVLEIDR
jgi:hypothetical protein